MLHVDWHVARKMKDENVFSFQFQFRALRLQQKIKDFIRI